MGAAATIAGGAAAGAAGSIASQTVGVATGIESKFSFGNVALSAIGAGIGSVTALDDIPGRSFVSDVARGALGSAITQGIGVATGLQSKFSWAGIAAAGIGAGVGGAVARGLDLKPLSGAGSSQSFANIAGTTLASTASALANAATRSIANGSDFGDNVMAALPDVIGQTVGGLLADGIASRPIDYDRSHGYGSDEDIDVIESDQKPIDVAPITSLSDPIVSQPASVQSDSSGDDSLESNDDIIITAMKPRASGGLFASVPYLNLPSATSRSGSKPYNFARPSSISAAPTYISLPRNVEIALEDAWSASFPGGHAQEQGGTLALEIGSSALIVTDTKELMANTNSFTPNFAVSNGDYVAGDFHTHPYDAGYNSISFSGADINDLINSSAGGAPLQSFSIVQSGREQFLLLKTLTTPTSISMSPKSMAREVDLFRQSLQAKGQSFSVSQNNAVVKFATKYGLAYYRGENGNLQKIN